MRPPNGGGAAPSRERGALAEAADVGMLDEMYAFALASAPRVAVSSCVARAGAPEDDSVNLLSMLSAYE
jgi:hypothetical protein